MKNRLIILFRSVVLLIGLVYAIDLLTQIIKISKAAHNDDLSPSFDHISEYDNLFKDSLLNNIEPYSYGSFKSQTKPPIIHFTYDKYYNMVVTKIKMHNNAFDCVKINQVKSLEDERSGIAYCQVNQTSFYFYWTPGENHIADSIIVRPIGKSRINLLINNKNMKLFSYYGKSLDIKLNKTGSYMFTQSERNISQQLTLLRNNDNLYLIFASPNKIDMSIPDDLIIRNLK